MASENDVDYRVKLTEAYLKICKVKVSPSISIEKRTGYLSHKTCGMQTVNHFSRKSFLEKDNIFNGLVVKTFVMGMVNRAAFNGDYKKNPFNFKTFTTSFLRITINGEVSFRPLQLSYTAANPRYIEAFLTIFLGTGKLFYNGGKDVTREEYANGNALYLADLTPDMCGSSDHFNLVQHRKSSSRHQVLHCTNRCSESRVL